MVTDYSFYDLADVVHVTRLSYHSLALSHIYDSHRSSELGIISQYEEIATNFDLSAGSNLKQITWYEDVVASLSLIAKVGRPYIVV